MAAIWVGYGTALYQGCEFKLPAPFPCSIVNHTGRKKYGTCLVNNWPGPSVLAKYPTCKNVDGRDMKDFCTFAYPQCVLYKYKPNGPAGKEKKAEEEARSYCKNRLPRCKQFIGVTS